MGELLDWGLGGCFCFAPLWFGSWLTSLAFAFGVFGGPLLLLD